MAWPKFSDNYGHDCWTLSDQAFRLHTEAICWNGQKLLDCLIPKDDLRRFGKHPAAVAELLAVGYWTDEGDAYRIAHHSEHQRTREEAVALQERNRKNGAKGGRPPKPRNNPDGNPDGNPEGEERSGEALLGEGSKDLPELPKDQTIGKQADLDLPEDSGQPSSLCPNCGEGHSAVRKCQSSPPPRRLSSVVQSATAAEIAEAWR